MARCTLGRIADRFGKGIRTAPRDALLAESVDETTLGRSFGLYRAMDTLGASIGVILITISNFYQGDYRAVFLYALSRLFRCSYAVLVRETKPPLMTTKENP